MFKITIDLLAILQKSLDRAIFFYTILYARFDRVALELRSQLCTFENSTNWMKYRSIHIRCENR